MSWKCIESEELISNRWIGVKREKVLLPNGEIIEDFYKVRVSNASAVVAMTDNMELVLKKEYRYCYDAELIELPSGVFEPAETDPLDVAKRELMEETGYQSDNWDYLGATIEDSAKLTNHIHLYLARGCRKMGTQHLDLTEDIDVLVLPIEEAVQMVMDNQISCSCSAHAILKVARMMGL